MSDLGHFRPIPPIRTMSAVHPDSDQISDPADYLDDETGDEKNG
jgi:hypothetical protein